MTTLALHDMADPVGALPTMRQLAGDDGVVLVVDERAGDFFGEPSDVEGLPCGFSILHCLPVAMADRPSAATGTVMRTDTFRDCVEAAGFGAVEILPFENLFWRFYWLDAAAKPHPGRSSSRWIGSFGRAAGRGSASHSWGCSGCSGRSALPSQ